MKFAACQDIVTEINIPTARRKLIVNAIVTQCLGCNLNHQFMILPVGLCLDVSLPVRRNNLLHGVDLQCAPT